MVQNDEFWNDCVYRLRYMYLSAASGTRKAPPDKCVYALGSLLRHAKGFARQGHLCPWKPLLRKGKRMPSQARERLRQTRACLASMPLDSSNPHDVFQDCNQSSAQSAHQAVAAAADTADTVSAAARFAHSVSDSDLLYQHGDAQFCHFQRALPAAWRSDQCHQCAGISDRHW